MNISQECIFCDIIADKSNATIIFDNEENICLMDKYPISKGHFLVIPKQHYNNVFEMPLKKINKMFSLSVKIGKIAKNVLNAKGMNFGQNNGEAANQIVPHVHVHVIPRYTVNLKKNKWPSRELITFTELCNICNLIKKELDF